MRDPPASHCQPQRIACTTHTREGGTWVHAVCADCGMHAHLLGRPLDRGQVWHDCSPWRPLAACEPAAQSLHSAAGSSAGSKVCSTQQYALVLALQQLVNRLVEGAVEHRSGSAIIRHCQHVLQGVEAAVRCSRQRQQGAERARRGQSAECRVLEDARRGVRPAGAQMRVRAGHPGRNAAGEQGRGGGGPRDCLKVVPPELLLPHAVSHCTAAGSRPPANPRQASHPRCPGGPGARPGCWGCCAGQSG